ncbi:UNVERIFIED_CONTAM: putative late blight resistance proteinR1A-10 [Sesamum angustifolium]|uniref:Late blight resistance proteinR1A-10 n=1 Tax=Sesamum angustifolium TaxID=2727405 RepID=A0AAW2QQ37_9LAMI
MRYLVVLDDMWQTRDWDILKRFLPDDKNGSRVMLTSRLGYIAACVHPSGSAHHMHFLQAAESWKLLKSKLFPKESCPKRLIQIGERIAVKCQGLPLAIVVVAGILSKMDKTPEVGRN